MVSQGITSEASSHSEQMENLYRHTNLVSTYSSLKLLPPEAATLIRYREDFVDRRVLDLGCGAGRLVAYLRPLVAHYTGLDISQHMLGHCHRQFPEYEFLEGDMRNLTQFKDASFDSILAVSNLFDAVAHGERLELLKSVRRILEPGGLLCFSAHNRNFACAGEGPRLERFRNPMTQLRVLFNYCKAQANHRRLKSQQQWEQDFALLNDSGNNFASFHYYISRKAQWDQLIECGFTPVECLDSHGQVLAESDDDSQNSSIHYLARKP